MLITQEVRHNYVSYFLYIVMFNLLHLYAVYLLKGVLIVPTVTLAMLVNYRAIQ